MRENHVTAMYLIVAVLLATALLAQDSTPPKSDLTGATSSVADPAAHSATPAVTVARAPHFVPVLISATDTHGDPVLGLTKEQITVLDANLEVQPLQLYRGADLSLHLGIVLLCSPRTFSQQQAAAIDLVNKVIRPGIDENLDDIAQIPRRRQDNRRARSPASPPHKATFIPSCKAMAPKSR